MIYTINPIRKIFIRLFFLGGGILALFGCRTYELYHYADISDLKLNGELIIEVVPSRELKELNGKKIAIESNPYLLLFKFFMDKKFSHIQVREVVLTGASSGKKINLSSSMSIEASRRSNPERYSVFVSFTEKLKDIELKYEAYNLDAILVLYHENGLIEKSDLSYRLEPEYERERRSDAIDGMMGI